VHKAAISLDGTFTGPAKFRDLQKQKDWMIWESILVCSWIHKEA